MLKHVCSIHVQYEQQKICIEPKIIGKRKLIFFLSLELFKKINKEKYVRSQLI